MKTLQEIEKEYESYEIQTKEVSNLDEFLTFIEIGIDDTEEYEADYAKELRENRLWKLEAMIRNFFFFIFQEEELEIYDEDTEIVQDCIAVTRKYREYYERIQALATEENFRELVRLVDFSCDYYSSQMDYYDYLRDMLEFNAKGIRMYNSKYQDSRESFDQFMEKRIKAMEEQQGKKGTPAPQYVKKG